MRVLSVFAVILILGGCGKKSEEDTPATSTAAEGDGLVSPASAVNSEKTGGTSDVAAAKGEPGEKSLPSEEGPSCAEVISHTKTIWKNSPSKGKPPKALSQMCDAQWTTYERECMLKQETIQDWDSCSRTGRIAGCESIFERLGKLVAIAGKENPGLAARESDFLKECISLPFSKATKCLLEATTLEEFSSCEDAIEVTNVVAGQAMGWEQAPIPGLESWLVEDKSFRDKSSRMDAQKILTARRVSPEKVKVTYTEARPEIVIHCEGEDVQLKMKVHLKIEANDELSAVETRIKIGDGAAEHWSADASAWRRSLFMRDPAKLLARLRDQDTLLLEFTPSKQKPINVKFDIDGLDDVLSQMAPCLGR